MARPTEAELGIDMTEEEKAILSRPVTETEDDFPASETEENDTLVQAKPEAKAEETPEAKATRERDEAGKFVAKKDDAQPEPKADPNKPPPGFVDNRALQEARAENKLLMERMTALLEASQRREAAKAKAEEPAPPAVPDLETDPLGYIRHMSEKVGKFEAETQAQAEARQAAEREQSEMAQVLTIAQPQFQEAAQADPTIQPTYDALINSFAREIAFNNGIPMDANGVPIAPQHKQFVAGELSKLENSHVKYAVQTGQNVASYMKGLAQARGISAQPAALSPTQATTPTTPPKTIAERASAQARHMSIGDLPGSAVPDKISAKDLVKMSSKEFAEFAKKMGDAELDKMFLNT